MAYDENLAARIRRELTVEENVVEKKMFGGLAFMMDGNMCCGISHDDFMARVGAGKYAEFLKLPHTRPMEMAGRPMKGMILVAPAGIDSAEDLGAWIGRCVAFTRTLPPK